MQLCHHLQEVLGIRPVYCRILANRGIHDFREARAFFRPKVSHLHDPWLLKGMEKAVERIDEALQKEEKILVYGDYDVDGTTAVGMVFSFLKNKMSPAKMAYYIPDRYKEGYGISKKGVDYAYKQGFTLIIALDCGVKAVEQITYARSLGLDFIICDHHLPGEKPPPAYALLNPKQKQCPYPYKELSGCGIGFKLICALVQYWGLPSESAFQYLDLVATSIAADIVPLTGENRTLAFLGLKKINTHPLPALQALIEVSDIKKELNLRDVVFMLAPRINAAGRMGDARNAVQLFIETKPEKAALLAKKLHEMNAERKKLEKAITTEILNRIKRDQNFSRQKTTVLYAPDWHKGVIGITASRIMETHYRPTVILSGAEGRVSGSARSVRGFNIYNALEECKDLLERFGGHFFAAGVSLKPEHIETFSQKFEEVVSEKIDPDLLIPEVNIDAELNLADLSEKFYTMLCRFEPFGPENPQPVFLLKGARDNGFSKLIGSNHIRFELLHPSCPERSFVGIGFNLAEKFDLVASGQPFDLCFSLEKNEFAGRSDIQLNVHDIRKTE